MKILISGGGIAGNALAFWLSRTGHDVTVVERFPSLRSTGLQIDLRGHGIEVLKRMGLEQAFRSKSCPEQGFQVVDDSGKRRAYFPANKSGKGTQGFTSEFEIMRGDFVSILYEANKSRVKYIFGTSIEHYEDTERTVNVKFANETADDFDLLVGADGQWSRTRRMMLGPDARDAIHLIPGMYIGYFTMPKPIQEKEEYTATLYLAPGRRGILTRRQNSKEIQVYLGGTSDSKQLASDRRGNIKAEKEALTKMFQGAGWQTEELLKGLEESSDFYCERLGLVKLSSWSKGRVVLVGDAAYCPSANTGMGTTSGIVGAYILAGEINKHCTTSTTAAGSPASEVNPDVFPALQDYETKFRPFMDQVQKGVLEDKGFMPSTSFGITAFHFAAGLASLLKLNVAGWMMKEKIKDWDLPDYPEMVHCAQAG